MKIVDVKVINKSKYDLPKYATNNSAGADLYANIDNEIIIKQGEIKLIKTGIFIELPSGYEAQIRARSGLALKNGITLPNGVGTIDSDYRGEIMVPLTTFLKEDFVIKPGMKIAQMIISEYIKANFIPANDEDLTDSDRGEAGFGSSGI